MSENEMDSKILNKNLQITKLTKEIDNLKSDLIDLREKFQEQYDNKMLLHLAKLYHKLDNDNDLETDPVTESELNALRRAVKHLSPNNSLHNDK